MATALAVCSGCGLDRPLREFTVRGQPMEVCRSCRAELKGPTPEQAERPAALEQLLRLRALSAVVFGDESAIFARAGIPSTKGEASMMIATVMAGRSGRATPERILESLRKVVDLRAELVRWFCVEEGGQLLIGSESWCRLGAGSAHHAACGRYRMIPI